MFFDLYIYFYFSIFSFSLLLLVYKYFLLMLIIVELIIMNISVLIYYNFMHINMEIIFIYYLVFSVCESVMGLTILVQIIRYYGSDFLSISSLIKF